MDPITYNNKIYKNARLKLKKKIQGTTRSTTPPIATQALLDKTLPKK